MYDDTHSYLTERGYKPLFNLLDNEISIITQTILDQTFGTIVEIALPHYHQRKTAERAIITSKNHLITMPCSAHDQLPSCLWCQLLLHIKLTLNLLRTSRVRPHLSPYHSMCRVFNFS